MRLVKIGLASLDPTVGALRSNTDQVIAVAREMAGARCAVGCFSEQVLSGYPAEDLVLWDGYVTRQWDELLRFAEATETFGYPSAFVVGLAVQLDGHVYNAAAVVCDGHIAGVVPKENLPTYGVFYERRTFSRGIAHHATELFGIPFGDLIFDAPFGCFAVEICEDLWAADGPMLRRAASGAELVINISASPWRRGVVEVRDELIATRAADHQCTVVYANQVGGQDALVFDGGGIINQNGRTLLAAPRWTPGWVHAVIDLERTNRMRAENTTWRAGAERYLAEHGPVCTVEVYGAPEPNDEAWPYPVPAERSPFVPADERPPSPLQRVLDDVVAAMKTGLGGYVDKTGAFRRLGVALSGGRDSALTACIATLYARDRFAHLDDERRAAEVRDFVQCFSMPTRYNTDTTRDLSRRLCDDLGLTLREIPIQDAFERELQATVSMLGGQPVTPLTLQNIQARIRGQRMWNWANSSGALWLQTGNMSEKAVGYTTVGGDLMGAYSLIGNMPKTMVIALLQYLAVRHGWSSLDDLLRTPASAELADDQEDERDLMPFPVLDACFALFAGDKLMPVDLYRALRARWTDDELSAMSPEYEPGQLRRWVKRFVRLFATSIFKWVQAPLAVHLGTLDLDRERALQLPVVTSLEWLDLDALDDLPD